MSFALRKSQTATIVATFQDTTQTPPVSYPLSGQPTFSDPNNNLVLTPDPANALNGPFTVTAVWGQNAVAGATGVIKCHGEGAADGSDPIDIPDLAYTLLGDEDNSGTMTVTVAATPQTGS